MTVKATIEHLLDNMEEEAIIENERTVTFSIRMRESDHERLTFLADFFGMKKTPFADMLLNDAMQETMQTIARHRAGAEDENVVREAYFTLLDEIQEHTKKAAS